MFPSTVFVLTAWNTPSSPTPALCFLLGRFHVLSVSDWMVLAQRGCPWSFIKQVPVPGNLFRILSLCTKTPFTIWPSFTWRKGCWETIIMPLKYGTVRFELLQPRDDFYKLQEKGTKKCCSIELCVCFNFFCHEKWSMYAYNSVRFLVNRRRSASQSSKWGKESWNWMSLLSVIWV